MFICVHNISGYQTADIEMQIPGDKADPFNLDFEKQFLEIDDEYETVRNIQKACYGGTKKGCFNCLSLVIGVILSFLWGLIMGMMQFFLIWMVIPYWKVIRLYYTPACAVVGALLNACFGKCFKNVASQGTTVNVTNGDAQKQDNNVPLVVSNIEPQQQGQYGAMDGQQTGYPKI